MTATEHRSPLPWALFAGWIAALAAIVTLLLRSAALQAHPEVLGPAIAIDLTLVTGGVFWWLLIRTGRASKRAVIPVVLIGLAIANALDLVDGRLAIGLAIAGGLAELTIAALALSKLRVIRRSFRAGIASGASFEHALADALAAHLPSPLLAEAVAAELTLLRLAVRGWSLKPEGGPDTWSVHRESGWTALAGGLMLMVLAETIGVHFLLARWSAAAAWVMTSLSLYSFLWLLGDTHALRLTPIRLVGSELILQVGLRWRARIPLAQIASAEPIHDPDEALDLDLALPGAPLVRLTLTAPVEVRGLFGIRRTSDRLVIGVDGRDGFLARIHSKIGDRV